MMKVVKQGFVMLVLSIAASGNPAVAAKQEPLLPLLPTDIPAVCGCSFVRYKSTGEAPLMHWASDGRQQAVVRTEGQRHVLELRQEKHMPERAGPPQANDRLVLFVANGDWQIQMLGNAMAGCPAKTQCTAHYQGRLLVQQGGGARTEIPVEGTCACPK
ncbi:MAG TPA: hypothetical protein VLC92_00055 [Rhodocyclaceae bacterium]|nr:hypothetical protein [Rhodocyclaceae bacterium]